MSDERSRAALALALAQATAGVPVDRTALGPRARRAAAVAGRLGAPLAPALAVSAAAADDERGRRWAVDRAAAEGRSVARALVVAPPVLGPIVALAVTDAPFAVWATRPGHVVLGLAGAMWLVGSVIVRQLVRAAGRMPRRGAEPPDELLDLAALGVRAGLAVPAALREAGAVLGVDVGPVALWLELGGAGPAPPGWSTIESVLRAAVSSGLAMAPLLTGLAADGRAVAQQAALERAARLAPRLTVPTALLLLPSALLVVAAPLVAGALGTLG